MFLDEVQDYLSTNGIGTNGVDLFAGYLPDMPNSAGAVYETGGLGPVRAMRSGPGRPVARQARVQVVWRSTSYPVAAAKVYAMYALLEGLGDVTLGGTRYLWGGAVQEPFKLGNDIQGRPMVACNFDLIRSTTT